MQVLRKLDFDQRLAWPPTGANPIHPSPAVWFTAFVGANLFQRSFSKFCPLETILIKLGVAMPSIGGSCA